MKLAIAFVLALLPLAAQISQYPASSGGGTPSGSAGGDLGGTYPNPTVTSGAHITNSSIPNSGLVNTGTTVNGQSCVLGTTCTVPAVTSVGFTGGLLSIATPTSTPAITVAGTSGGIPYFSGAAAWASSSALTAHGVVLGGGAATAPTSTAAGTAGQVLTSGGASADPTFQAPGPNACTDYTSSGRVFGTTYQNTTGKPLYIQVWGHDSAADQIHVQIDTFTPPTTIRNSIGAAGGTNAGFMFVVVPNSYYLVDYFAGVKTLLGWYECG